jgi:hypothetical protein
LNLNLFVLWLGLACWVNAGGGAIVRQTRTKTLKGKCCFWYFAAASRNTNVTPAGPKFKLRRNSALERLLLAAPGFCCRWRTASYLASIRPVWEAPLWITLYACAEGPQENKIADGWKGH